MIYTLGRVLQFLHASGANPGLFTLFRHVAIVRFTEFVISNAVDPSIYSVLLILVTERFVGAALSQGFPFRGSPRENV